MTQQPELYRVRITFGKLDALRFIGHLDLAKTWERVLRRAQVPLVYSQGFNPQPKMQLASALPLGISSECELLDIWLLEPVDLQALPTQLNEVSPPGLRTYQAQEVALRSPALQNIMESGEYLIMVTEVDEDTLRQRIDAFMAREHVERERRGKTYDLRPLVFSIALEPGGQMRVRLAAGDRGNARPDEFLDALGLDFGKARCHRTALYVGEAGSH